jgi:hypothetical protein
MLSQMSFYIELEIWNTLKERFYFRATALPDPVLFCNVQLTFISNDKGNECCVSFGVCIFDLEVNQDFYPWYYRFSINEK